MKLQLAKLAVILATSVVMVAAGAQTYLPVQWMYGAINQVYGVAYSPDGTKLAVVGNDAIQVYSTSTNALLMCLPTGASQQVSSVAFSPDGSTLASGGTSINSVGAQGVLEFWNASNGAMIVSLPTATGGQGGVSALAFSADGTTLVSGGSGASGGVVEVWNLTTDTLTKSLATSASVIESVAISHDGSVVVDGGSTGSAGVLELWNGTTGSLTKALGTGETDVRSLALTSDGETLVAGGVTSALGSGFGVVEVWSVAGKSLTQSLPTSAADVYSVALTADNKTLADSGRPVGLGGSGIAELWNLSNGALHGSLNTSASNAANAVCFSPSGSSLVIGGSSLLGGVSYLPVLEVWSVANQALTSTLNTNLSGAIFSGAFTPDGSSIALGGQIATSALGQVGSLQMWNVAGGQQTISLPTTANGGVTAVSFRPDGVILAAGGSASTNGVLTGVLELWSWTTNTLSISFNTTASNGVTGIAFSKDGLTLVDGGASYDVNTFITAGVLEVWDLTSDSLKALLNTSANGAVNSVAISPDQTLIADCGVAFNGNQQQGVAELWNLSTDTQKATLNVGSYLNQVAFSPDGKTLAICGTGVDGSGNPLGVAVLWPFAVSGSQQITLPLAAGTGYAYTASFSKDGKTLFVGTDLGIQVFDVTENILLVDFNGGILDSTSNFAALSPDNSLIGFVANNNAFGNGVNPLANSVAISGVSVNPSTVQGGATSVGTIVLMAAAPVGGASIQLSSSSLSATVPGAVLVPQGGTTATFNVTTSAVNSQTTATISAGNKTTTLTITPPVLTGVNVSPSAVGGGASSTGTVTLSGPAGPVGVVVGLTSSSLSAVVAPSVTVAAGQTSATFTITTSSVSAKTTVTITATLAGQNTVAELTLTPSALLAVSVSPSTVAGGANSVGTVTLTGVAGTNGFVVTLTSSNLAATVPASVTVAAGQGSATFTVSTSSVASTETATISAVSGGLTKTAALLVKPVGVLSLGLNPTTVAGGLSATGTVTLTGPAPSKGVIVKLSSNSVSAKVPATVMIAAGKTSETFVVSTVGVPSPIVVTLAASLSGSSQVAALTITSPGLASISVAPSSVPGGTASKGTVTLTGAAVRGGMKVTLSSNTRSAIPVTSVVVPAGKATATFTIRTIAVPSQVGATITGVLGTTTQAATLTINPPSVKSLKVSPASVKGGASSTGTVTLTSAAPVGGLLISLGSSSTSATTPVSVTVLAGRTSAVFLVKTKKVTSPAIATITASGGGSSESAALTIK